RARTSWTAKTTTATEARHFRAGGRLDARRRSNRRTMATILKRSCLLLIALLVARSSGAQDVRQHTRPTGPKGTKVTDSQAAAVTLTLSTVALRTIQTWIRTAGTIDKAGRTLTALLSGPEASIVKVGQRV